MKSPSVQRKKILEELLGTDLTFREYNALKEKFLVFWMSPYKLVKKGKIEYTYGSHHESYTMQDIKNWLNEIRA